MREETVTLMQAKTSIRKAIQLHSFIADLTFKEIEKLGYSNQGQDGLTLVAVDIINKLKLVEKFIEQQESA